jgi:hypothetical protein
MATMCVIAAHSAVCYTDEPSLDDLFQTLEQYEQHPERRHDIVRA